MPGDYELGVDLFFLNNSRDERAIATLQSECSEASWVNFDYYLENFEVLPRFEN